MQVMAALRKSGTLAAAMTLATLSTSVSANQIEETPSAGAIVADAAFARPMYIILSQAGALVYGATLPLTLLTNSADEVAKHWWSRHCNKAFCVAWVVARSTPKCHAWKKVTVKPFSTLYS